MAKKLELLTPIERRHVWDGKKRHYEIGGVTRPGVTTIIDITSDKTFLKRWEERIGVEQAEIVRVQAARRGTALHKRIETKLLFGDQEQLSLFDQQFEEEHGLCSEVDYLWMSAEPFLDTVGEPVLIEGPVYWQPPFEEQRMFGTGFAGTIDCVTRDPKTGGLVCRDWKSSLRRKPEEWLASYCLQQAAYALAFDFCYGRLGLTIDRCEIAIFNLEGKEPQVHAIEGSQLELMKLAWFKRLERFYAIEGRL